jgi:hypothetical protein
MMTIALPNINSLTMPPPVFTYQPIVVKRWRILDADVFQTIYIPDPHTNLYRVSITKDLVIAEYMHKADDYDFWRAFGMYASDATPLDQTHQRFGKIAPINDHWRKKFMFDLTTEHNIFSLGRFATWRNILLDDVVKDLNVIKRMMGASLYEHRLEVSR